MTPSRNSYFSEARLVVAGLLLAALPLAAQAQQAGDLTGSRPSAASRPAASQSAKPSANADAGLAALIKESVDLNRATADEMPDLYGRFIDAVREQRRQWTERDWTNASDALSRLNARYEVVRTGIDMEDRIRIRSWQGEFRTLQGARKVNQKLDEKNVNVK
ncbi:hypothetical protein FNT36_16970 [Hymenobacter setariae]|uniref:DUF3347 domain-containing protein n=1 Tax=Hymenobacter setariae TaxID=2594794 RepID=A0A558BS46_9BACT|nr:hypothetical protein [Hymenobacter setariae]TVT39347.1 hypothetical protein FNT36_16970 [Hymenobacter setariae]